MQSYVKHLKAAQGIIHRILELSAHLWISDVITV